MDDLIKTTTVTCSENPDPYFTIDNIKNQNMSNCWRSNKNKKLDNHNLITILFSLKNMSKISTIYIHWNESYPAEFNIKINNEIEYCDKLISPTTTKIKFYKNIVTDKIELNLTKHSDYDYYSIWYVEIFGYECDRDI